MMKRLKTHAIALMTVGLSFGTAALAEPLAREWQDESQWRYSATAYAFLPASTKGTSTVAGSPVALDLDLGEAVELLDIALSGRVEAWRNDFGMIFDLNYVDLGVKETVMIPVPPGIPVTVDADIRQLAVGFLLAKRVVNRSRGPENLRFSFDLQGGVRYNELKQEIILGTPGPTPVLGGTETWFEPVIGGRAVWELNDKWLGAVAADFGGFGAGGNDLQIGANAGFSRRIGKNKALRLGYRYYSMDFSTTRADGVFAYDVEQHGPYIGFTWHFQ